MRLSSSIPCLAALLCAGILPAAQAAAENIIPDYSQTERAQVPDEFKFRVEDLFINEAAWRAELAELAKLITTLDGMAKDWTATPGQTANLLELISTINERGERLENDISPEVCRNVIKTVRANLAPLHRFFKLKQRMLGLAEFNYYDIYAPGAPSVEKPYTYQESQQLILAAMAPLGGEYARGLQRAFAERWIDLYPNKGKQSGGYSTGIYGAHPYIKMNYSGRYDDVSVLAHELGHAMHALFSNAAQPFATAEYPIFLAEIASTFNENLLLNEALKSGTDDREKLRLLESYLERMRGTIYAQTMYADFELAMHEHVEQGLPLTATWLESTWLEKFNCYMGTDQGVMSKDDTMSVQWAAIPHFFRPYYVFQYVTGMVASSALAEAVTQGGAPEVNRYLTMLRAGGSKSPLDILRDSGVDMSKPGPIEAAIRQFDRLVAEMETLYTRLPEAAARK